MQCQCAVTSLLHWQCTHNTASGSNGMECLKYQNLDGPEFQLAHLIKSGKRQQTRYCNTEGVGGHTTFISPPPQKILGTRLCTITMIDQSQFTEMVWCDGNFTWQSWKYLRNVIPLETYLMRPKKLLILTYLFMKQWINQFRNIIVWLYRALFECILISAS